MKHIAKSLSKREYLFIPISLVLIIIQVWADLRTPEFMSEITMLIQTPGSSLTEVLITGALMLACSLLSFVLTISVSYFTAQLSATVAMKLREKVYKKTMSFSMNEISEFSTPSLITRSTNDITQIQSFIAMGYSALFRAPLMAILAISKITGISQEFSIVTAIAVCSLVVVMSGILFLAIPKSKTLQKLTDKLNLVTREQLQGVRVVRAYNAQDYQKEKFEKVNEEVAYTNTFVGRVTAVMGPYMGFLMSGLSLAIYFIGSFLINEAMGMEKLTIFSNMVVFSSYAMQIIMAFMMLTFNVIMAPRTIVALNRISEVLDSENEIKDGNELTGKENSENTIEFKNVSFSYEESDEEVLDNISFKAKKGETIAIIGSTGSGKSTLINLIPRFYDVTKGEVLIDGVNVKDYDTNALREKIGLVTQKATLFSGDITSNIAFGKNKESVNSEMVKTAVAISQAQDFVEKAGYDSSVSQGGLNLSGGQKQRVSIARAVYKKAPIYIFDDCFSALDYKTDKELRKALDEKTSDSTKIMVAQRISTIKDADKIIVLDEGKMVGYDNHENLLKSCTVYREIAYSQLTKEELGDE